jgi:hypothetical protein
LSAWQAASVEVKQDEAKKQQKHDLPSELVDSIIERTTVESASSDLAGLVSRFQLGSILRPAPMQGWPVRRDRLSLCT